MRAPRIAIALALAALTATGCSSEGLTERLTEEVAERAAGEDVDIDIDTDSGELSIEGQDGSMRIRSGDLPDSFPDDLPVPEGDFEVASSFEQSGDDRGLELQVALMTTGAVGDLSDYFEAALPEAGWEITQKNRSELAGIESVVIAAEKAGVGALINIGAMEEGETLVNYGIGAASDS